jgi:hypothetical protein
MNYYVLDKEIIIAARKRYLVFDASTLLLKKIEDGHLSKINYLSHCKNLFMFAKENQEKIIEFADSTKIKYFDLLPNSNSNKYEFIS